MRNRAEKRPSLSWRMARILEMIIAYKLDHDGNSPSFTEIAESTDMSHSTVVYNLRGLEQTGHITIDDRQARSIQVSDAKWVPPEGLNSIKPETKNRQTRQRKSKRTTRPCECGNPGEFTLHSACGPITLCRSCARIELEAVE